MRCQPEVGLGGDSRRNARLGGPPGVRITPADVRKRYATTQRLSPRGSGSPFDVKWAGDRLVATAKGAPPIEVTLDELRRVWGALRAGVPAAQLQQLTRNARHVEAIFDDLTSRLGPEVEVADAETSGDAPVASAHAATAESDALHDLRRKLADVGRELYEAQRQNGASEARVARVEADLESRSHQLREVVAARAESEAKLARLQREVASAKRASKSIIVRLDGAKFEKTKNLPPEVWKELDKAAGMALSDPSTSIAVLRRTLETAIQLRWRAETGKRLQERRVSDLLEDLREKLDPNDWHLAKNLYSRGSAVFHGRIPATVETALWMFFGTAEWCEQIGRTASAEDGP